MRSSVRQRSVLDRPGLGGVARVDRRTRDVLPRLDPGRHRRRRPPRHGPRDRPGSGRRRGRRGRRRRTDHLGPVPEPRPADPGRRRASGRGLGRSGRADRRSATVLGSASTTGRSIVDDLVVAEGRVLDSDAVTDEMDRARDRSGHPAVDLHAQQHGVPAPRAGPAPARHRGAPVDHPDRRTPGGRGRPWVRRRRRAGRGAAVPAGAGPGARRHRRGRRRACGLSACDRTSWSSTPQRSIGCRPPRP